MKLDNTYLNWRAYINVLLSQKTKIKIVQGICFHLKIPFHNENRIRKKYTIGIMLKKIKIVNVKKKYWKTCCDTLLPD